MKINRPFLLSLIFLALVAPTTHAQTTLTFESLPLPSSGYYNGDTSATSPYRDNYSISGTRDNFGATETLQQWEHGGVDFFNSYTADFGSWNGFSWSNVVDTVTSGYGNQYAAFPGGGSDGAGGANANETYVIAFGDSAWFNLPDAISLTSVDLANTTWAATSMRDGDAFSKQFGGVTGDDPDYFRVTFTGYDRETTVVDPNGDGEFEITYGNEIGSIDFVLVDYRFADNSQDYIQDIWQRFDLSPISNARSVGLTFFSTDSGDFGINTPAYVAIDNLTFSTTTVPEPASLALLMGAAAGFFVLRRSKKAAI